MGEVILGLPGPCTDDNCELADHYMTKMGGLPVSWFLIRWIICTDDVFYMAVMHIVISTVFRTGHFLILQLGLICLRVEHVYAPVSTKGLTIEEHILYVFGCVRPECGGDPSSWRAVRVQKSFSSKEPNLQYDEVAPLPSSSLSAPKDWREDLWTFDSGEDDDGSKDDIDLEELVRALSEAAMISSNTKKQNSEPETVLKPSPVSCKIHLADKFQVLPCFYIYIQEEKISKEVTSVCSKFSSVSINRIGSDLEDNTCEENWEEESYEYDRALHADRTDLKFKKRMDAYPEQCIRYSCGEKPLLATLEEIDCGKCSLCGAPRHYEMQLMSPLLYFLQEATTGQEKITLENWNWMTLIIYTCSMSCAESTREENSGNQGWIVAEEAVIVQHE